MYNNRIVIQRLIWGLLFTILIHTTEIAAVPVDRIVAVVNEDIIAQSELNARIQELAAKLANKSAELPPMGVLQKQMLDHMIDLKLQLQTAQRLGIRVDDVTLNKAIANIATKNDITLLQLKETLEADGISFALFREQLREDILLNRLKQKEVINRISITEQDVDDFLARETGSSRQRTAVHLNHMLIATPEGASPETIQTAKSRAEDLVDKLRSGADFAQTAMRESDARNALDGGDLGWIESTRIPSMFIKTVDKLEPGQISDPIRNASGFHIIKLVDAKGTKRMIVQQTEARHILINTNEIVSDAEARQRLETLRERILGGESFEVMARSHSDDKASAVKGGDLGWTSPGDLVPIFEEEMNALPINEISEPFKTQFGWHIVQVLDRRDHDNTDDVLRNNARLKIREQKADEAIDLWLRRLRDEAYVEIMLSEDQL